MCPEQRPRQRGPSCEPYLVAAGVWDRAAHRSTHNCDWGQLALPSLRPSVKTGLISFWTTDLLGGAVGRYCTIQHDALRILLCSLLLCSQHAHAADTTDVSTGRVCMDSYEDSTAEKCDALSAFAVCVAHVPEADSRYSAAALVSDTSAVQQRVF